MLSSDRLTATELGEEIEWDEHEHNKNIGGIFASIHLEKLWIYGNHTNKQIAVAFFNHLKERTDEFTQTQELKNGEK